MTDVEWMFGDAATGMFGFGEMAGLNPLRWSGSITFQKAYDDMEEVIKQGSRPIVVKIPSGVSTKEKEFQTPQEALAFIQSKDPVHIAALAAAAAEEERKRILKQEAEDKRAAVGEREQILADAQAQEKTAKGILDEALAAAGAKASSQCEWMFADAGAGMGSLGMVFSHVNPMRWSGAMTFDKAKLELEGLVKHAEEKGEAQRPISMKVPPGISTKEEFFETTQAAIDRLLKDLEGEGDSALSKLENDHLESNATVIDAAARLEQAKAAADKAEDEAKAAGALD